MIRNYLSVLLVSMFLSGCASQQGNPVASGVANTTCAGTTGHTNGNIKYRTHVWYELGVKLDFNVTPSSELRLKLQPHPSSISETVKTIGVSCGGPGACTTGWMNGLGSGNTNTEIILCVPNEPVGTWYKFDIEVGSIGKLDPRVTVVPQ